MQVTVWFLINLFVCNSSFIAFYYIFLLILETSDDLPNKNKNSIICNLIFKWLFCVLAILY